MKRLQGLYAVTPQTVDTDALCRMVLATLEGGADAVQYRQKDLLIADATDQARALQALCRQFGRPLIINDSVELARIVGADGVHLGRDDVDPRTARQQVGASMMIGVSCYDRFDLAQAAAEIADHVAFGSLFASPTKPAAVRAPLTLFAQARAAGLNSVGIGGIDVGNAESVGAAGADAIAVISAIFEADDIATATRELRVAFMRGVQLR